MRDYGVYALAVASAAIFSTIIWIAVAWPRPSPQWADKPIEITRWFQSLMQPDNPTASCCGEADAFEADEYETSTEGGDLHLVAIITDGRGMIPNGTRIAVPATKVKWDSGNPTGHGILFLSSEQHVYCYVLPGGV